MFQDLQRYDRYVSNNSPWLGALPSHWSTQRTKSLLVERSQKGFPDEPLLASTQSHGVILKSDYATRTVTATKDLHLLKLVEVGDFVISLRSFQGGIERCHHRGIISPAYTVLTAKSDKYRDYLTYLFKSKPFVDSLTLCVTGIREGQNIDYATLAVDLLPVPPVDEQTAIVKYLAHANARINKAIAAKRRLIALLDEAVAVQVTGVLEGLGAPRRLSSLLWEGPTNGTSPEISETGDLETFSISAIRNGIVDVRSSDIKYVERARVNDVNKYLLTEGDVLLVRGNGNIKLVGRSALVAEDMNDRIYPDLLMRLRFRSNVLPQFAVQILNSSSVRLQIEGAARTAVGTYKLSGADVRGIRIPVPDVEVQQRVVNEIEAVNDEHLQAVNRLSEEIALLQEFRTRLVADVVTGQVDVRDVAVTLPDAIDVGADAVEKYLPGLDEELVDAGEGDDA